MKHIDPHVHPRPSIHEVAQLARAQGIVAILLMPNGDRPVLREEDLIKKLAEAQQEEPLIKCFFYLGLTANEAQIREAVRVVDKYPQAIGLKLYTAKSGILSVSRETDQWKVYRTLAKLDYRGVLAVHCQKQSKFRPGLWDPKNPWTHCLVQPPEAEIASVKDQIRLARRANFKGHLHFVHISCPESVELVVRAKKQLRITCGVTPHHILWSYYRLKDRIGIFDKSDPPLRNNKTVRGLRKCLVEGKIDWVETDYAFHTLTEKLFAPYQSGIAAYGLYQDLLAWLSRRGVSPKEIENLTYLNIKRAFGEKLKEV